MKTFARKLSATLLAIAMLAAVLPLGGLLPVSADIDQNVNLISNPGFEATGADWQTGQPNRKVYWSLSQSTTISADAKRSGGYGAHLQGNGGWGGMLQAPEIAVLPFCEYTLSFWYNVQSSGVNYTLTGNQSGNKYASGWLSGASGWQEVTVNCLTGDDTTLCLNFNGGNTGVAESVYVDDFNLTLVKRGFAEPVKNGDFEEGNVDGWSYSGGSATVTTEVANGEYALKFTNAYYSYINYSMAVKPNTDYAATVSVRTVAANERHGINITVRDNAWNSDPLASQACGSVSSDKWDTYTLEFNSGNNTSLNFRLQSSWGVETYFYVDDIYVESLGGGADSAALPNGGFELGDKSNWNDNASATITEESHNGRYALQITNPSAWAEAAIRTLTVTPDTNYQVSWWAKRVSGTGAFNVIVSQTVSPWASFTKLSGQNYMNETSGEWVKYTCVYNSGDNTKMLLKFTSEVANAGSIIIDDVSVIELTDVSTDGLITNGTFECGNTTGWTTSGSVCTDAATNGHFGVYLTDNGGWGGLLRQDVELVEGRTYRLTFDYRAMTNGVNYSLQGGDVNYGSGWLDKRVWTRVEKVFRATASTTATLNFNGGGNGLASHVFLDNIKLELIPDDEVNLLNYHGKSAMEMDDAGSVGGLAFLFSANIKDFRYVDDNSMTEHQYTVYKYDEKSGKANPYTNELFATPYDYTVVRMGAIVSNQTGDDLTLDTVNGNRIINIVGKKAMKEWCDDTTYAYGVRVTNVPKSAFNHTIYARPYITILVGDEEVTLYGEVQSGNCAALLEEGAV